MSTKVLQQLRDALAAQSERIKALEADVAELKRQAEPKPRQPTLTLPKKAA